MFKKATKTQARLRMALIGPSGSGKTYTALGLASCLGTRVAVIDTERGSASKYADLFDFDVVELASFHPQQYVEAIRAAVAEGYDVLVIDSLSHAWSGVGGILEQVDKAAARQQSKNTFTAWKDVTPMHNQLVDTILAAPLHVIVTMRAKSEYILEKDERTGKTTPRKIGLAPVQRDGIEYEFDVTADMDINNTLIVSKTRCSALAGAVIERPDAQLGEVLKAWLTDGAEMPVAPFPQQLTSDTPVVTPPATPKNGGEDKPNGRDWNQFWSAWKAAGFTPGNAEQIKTVLGVEKTYGMDVEVAFQRLEAYQNGGAQTPEQPTAEAELPT